MIYRYYIAILNTVQQYGDKSWVSYQVEFEELDVHVLTDSYLYLSGLGVGSDLTEGELALWANANYIALL